MTMRLTIATVACALVAITAHAQGADDQRGYIEGVAQASFGNVTSQAFGVEGGFRVATNTFVFGEVGHANDTAPAELGTAAQQVAGAIGAGYAAKQPMTFFDAGLRYQYPAAPNIRPYAMAGFGVAQVTHDVTFTVGGNDVTNSMSTYGVVLGSDLSGSETAAMLVLGGGVQWTPWERLVADLQFRYGRVSTEGSATNITRAGIGIGVKF